MNLSLHDFLKTGMLGPLRLGLTAEEVLRILGPPDENEVTIHHQQKGDVWQCGTFVFGFGSERNRPEELASIEWVPKAGEAVLLPDSSISDWAITAVTGPMEVRAYLRDAGLKFRYRSRKGYFEKVPVPALWRKSWPDVDEELLAQQCHPLTFKKPKNEADIVDTITFFHFFLASGVDITFVNERLQYLGISAEE